MFQVGVAPQNQQHVVTDISVFMKLHSASLLLQDEDTEVRSQRLQ